MSQVAFDEHVYKVGKGWLETIRLTTVAAKNGLVIGRITVKGQIHADDEILVVLAGVDEGGPKVAFHSADMAETLWTGLSNRLRNGKLKWREDEYAR